MKKISTLNFEQFTKNNKKKKPSRKIQYIGYNRPRPRHRYRHRYRRFESPIYHSPRTIYVDRPVATQPVVVENPVKSNHILLYIIIGLILFSIIIFLIVSRKKYNR